MSLIMIVDSFKKKLWK